MSRLYQGKYLLFLVWVFVYLQMAHGQVSRRTPVVEVVEKVGPAIVNINTERLVRRSSPFGNDHFFEEFFGRFTPRVYKTQSLGSGVIVDKSGFIVTNEHVIRRASKVNIILYDQKQYSAEVIAANADHDLALLKINSPAPLPAIEWGTSSDIMIGETAIALGNPFGLRNTVTTGVISATDRSIAVQGKVYFSDFIQTDAAINPGNSGGALLNIHGQLIGINSAIYAQGQGLGFAIPVDRVRVMLGELLNYDKLKGYWLGLESEEVQRNDGEWMVRVKSVDQRSQAHKNGIRQGDLIVAVDGNPIHSRFELHTAIYHKTLGDPLQLRVLSEKSAKTHHLTISRVPAKSSKTILWKRLGIVAENSPRGVIVSAVRRNSPAARIGIAKGDILQALANYEIEEVRDVELIVEYIPRKETVPVILLRNGERLGGKIFVE